VVGVAAAAVAVAHCLALRKIVPILMPCSGCADVVVVAVVVVVTVVAALFTNEIGR
jgi:hypothetical protein